MGTWHMVGSGACCQDLCAAPGAPVAAFGLATPHIGVATHHSTNRGAAQLPGFIDPVFCRCAHPYTCFCIYKCSLDL